MFSLRLPTRMLNSCIGRPTPILPLFKYQCDMLSIMIELEKNKNMYNVFNKDLHDIDVFLVCLELIARDMTKKTLIYIPETKLELFLPLLEKYNMSYKLSMLTNGVMASYSNILSENCNLIISVMRGPNNEILACKSATWDRVINLTHVFVVSGTASYFWTYVPLNDVSVMVSSNILNNLADITKYVSLRFIYVPNVLRLLQSANSYDAECVASVMAELGNKCDNSVVAKNATCTICDGINHKIVALCCKNMICFKCYMNSVQFIRYGKKCPTCNTLDTNFVYMCDNNSFAARPFIFDAISYIKSRASAEKPILLYTDNDINQQISEFAVVVSPSHNTTMTDANIEKINDIYVYPATQQIVPLLNTLHNFIVLKKIASVATVTIHYCPD